MSSTWTGNDFADIYKSVIKFGDNDIISASLKVLSDGFGNDLPIKVSTTTIEFTGNVINSKSGVTGVSVYKFTGSIYSGGGITDTKPLFLIEPSGVVSSTNWHNFGTAFGINLPNAFAGDIINVQKDSTFVFKVTSNGISLAAGAGSTPSIKFPYIGIYADGSSTGNANLYISNLSTPRWYFAEDTFGTPSGIGTGPRMTRVGGSASTPSYHFSDDTNTGMYRTTSDTIGFSTGGTLRMSISTSVITLNLRLVTLASASGGAGFNLPNGAAPSSPTDGDLWNDGTNLKARIAGTTVTII